MTLNGFLAPGTPGYIPEPATRYPVFCGTLAANTISSGAGS